IWTTWNSSPGRWNHRPPEPGAADDSAHPRTRPRPRTPAPSTPGHPARNILARVAPQSWAPRRPPPAPTTFGTVTAPGVLRRRHSARCAAPSSWRGGVLGEEVQHTVQSFLCRGCGQVELVLVAQGRVVIAGIEYGLGLHPGLLQA